MSKGWYGNRMGHSLASRGIKVSELKQFSGEYKFYPYNNAKDMYDWLVDKRDWDSHDALEYVQAVIDDNRKQAMKIVDENYAYVSTIDAFPDHDLSELSTIYYSIMDSEKVNADPMSSWSYKYAFSGSVWDDPEDMDEQQLEWQKDALETMGIVGIDDNPTHALMGTVPFSNPEEIYHNMQGDNWSPLGEARQLVRRNQTHTSMSIGDIVKTPDGKYKIVSGIGFLDLDELRKYHGLDKQTTTIKLIKREMDVA